MHLLRIRRITNNFSRRIFGVLTIFGFGLITGFIWSTDYIKTNQQITNQGTRNFRKIVWNIPSNTLKSDVNQIEKEDECDKLGNFTIDEFIPIPNIFAKNLLNRNKTPFCGKNGLLEPWRFTKTDKDEIWMLFLVKSAPSHYRRRITIRDTWSSISSLRGVKFATLFLLGRTGTSEKDDLLKEENDIYGDMLQCDFIDDYKSLPTKVLLTFGWLLEGHVTSAYVTVTDDDCVMNLINIFVFFRAAQEDAFYCGFMYDNSCKPHRENNSKWFINQTVYPDEFYPTFCHGGMWTIPYSYLLNIKCVSEVTDQNNFYLEDVYITGILRTKLGSKNDNIKKVQTNSGKNFHLMYYTWDEGTHAYLKMATRWHRLNRTLPWRRMTSPGEQPIITTYLNYKGSDLQKENLSQKWRKIITNQRRTNVTTIQTHKKLSNHVV